MLSGMWASRLLSGFSGRNVPWYGRVPLVIASVAWNGTIGDGWPKQVAQYPKTPMDADYPERRLLALGERIGAAVVPTRALLARSGDVFIRDGHLNARGHRALADALLAAITERQLLAR